MILAHGQMVQQFGAAPCWALPSMKCVLFSEIQPGGFGVSCLVSTSLYDVFILKSILSCHLSAVFQSLWDWQKLAESLFLDAVWEIHELEEVKWKWSLGWQEIGVVCVFKQLVCMWCSKGNEGWNESFIASLISLCWSCMLSFLLFIWNGKHPSVSLLLSLVA